MPVLAKYEDCTGCGSCSDSCHNKAIKMVPRNGFGHLYPYVEKDKCIECGACEKSCPFVEKTLEQIPPQKCYAAWVKDIEENRKSTSGGMATLFAQRIIDLGGVVYGCANIGIEFKHVRVDNREALESLRGSKYVQSKIGNTYCQCKKDLQENRIVCFSGTPCQIEGLLNYLGDKFENLITIDLVCHGVPSPKVWSIYLADIEKKEKATIAGYSFRSKKTGYHDFGTEILLSNGKSIYTHDKGVEKDFMHLAFFNELCSRPSCHDCAFKTLERRSDFTLFDLWHMSDFNAKYEDDKGTSAVFIHSLKGYNIIRELAQKHTVVEIDYQKAMELDGNNIEFSMIPNKRREEFFLDLDNLSIDELKVKYFSNRRVVNQSVVIKKMLKKIGIFNSTKKFVYTISKYRSRGRFK